VRDGQRRAQGDRAGRDQINPAPQAISLSGGEGFQSTPIDAQIFSWREFSTASTFVLPGSETQSHRSHRCDRLPATCVESAILGRSARFGAVIDTREVQPESLLFLRCGRRGELIAVPPATAVWAVLRHWAGWKRYGRRIACAGIWRRFIPSRGRKFSIGDLRASTVLGTAVFNQSSVANPSEAIDSP